MGMNGQSAGNLLPAYGDGVGGASMECGPAYTYHNGMAGLQGISMEGLTGEIAPFPKGSGNVDMSEVLNNMRFKIIEQNANREGNIGHKEQSIGTGAGQAKVSVFGLS